MINVDNLSYSFPQKDLYNKISFALEDGQHCAFIGTSGSGKSTLIDIIMDPEKYMFDGTLEIDDACRIGYVSQFSQLDQTKDMTVFEFVGEDFIRLQNKITSLCTEMETGTDLESLLEQYQYTIDQFNAIHGDDFENNIMKQLNLANLGKLKDLDVSALSGGEFKLLQVIKEMLLCPNLIIMDEPDVFLDFENLVSLKNLINAHKGILLIITHSRYLLNHCFNKIIHLENMELQEFDGSYVEYNFSLLETKIEIQELAIADDNEIERNEALINRLRLIATHNSESARGKSLKARIKLQQRLRKRRIKAPFVYIKKPRIDLQTDNEIEDTIALKVENYNVSFDEVLLENVNFEIGSKDKVAIIGPNGTGKTTLFRSIFKNNQEAITVDENIELAYLSQKQGEMLNESNTIRLEFFDAGFKTIEDIRYHISKYGFYGDDIDRKIGDMSGGEKNSLQLAKVSGSKANMLLLDEPTSHLDTYSQLALEEAMQNYNGAIMMISHDYYSIINSMDYVLIIENKGIRKMTMKKFKRMIYARHFNRNYLELEQEKKAMETKVEVALSHSDFELAKIHAEELGVIIEKINAN